MRSGSEAKKERLAAALRENLKRRKARAKALDGTNKGAPKTPKDGPNKVTKPHLT